MSQLLFPRGTHTKLFCDMMNHGGACAVNPKVFLSNDVGHKPLENLNYRKLLRRETISPQLEISFVLLVCAHRKLLGSGRSQQRSGSARAAGWL